jgi:hypothetical protein
MLLVTGLLDYCLGLIARQLSYTHEQAGKPDTFNAKP